MPTSISAGSRPKILISKIGGDLSLMGWDSDEILIKADDDELQVKQEGEQVRIACDDDISMRVPRSATVLIENISGDASIRGVMGGIELKEIHGDLSIRDVNSVSIDTIGSDLSLRGAKGNLFVKHANSDVSIRDVEGNVTLESVADDLALRDARGNVAANVSEDVVLYLNPRAGHNYAVSAGEDILLVMPPGANATLSMHADDVDVDWKGIDKNDSAGSQGITLGDGSAAISLNAGGDIRVTSQADAGDSAEDFGNFAGIGFDWSGFGEQISRRVDRVARRATRQAELATRHATRRVTSKLNVGVGRWNWDMFPSPDAAARKPQASEEERMAILKMLQEKKITADEADKLLAALEGDA